MSAWAAVVVAGGLSSKMPNTSRSDTVEHPVNIAARDRAIIVRVRPLAPRDKAFVTYIAIIAGFLPIVRFPVTAIETAVLNYYFCSAT